MEPEGLWGGGGEITFRLEGDPYTICLPEDGRETVGWAAMGNWPSILPGALCEESSARLYRLLTDMRGPVGLRACWRTVHHLSVPIYGVPWWTAQRLAATATENHLQWSAWTVTAGFDPAGQSAHRICAAILAWLQTGITDKKEAQKLETQLFAPPRPVRSRAPGGRSPGSSMPGFTPQEQAASFQKAFAALGGGG